MVIREDGPATEYEEIDRWEHGVGWIAHPDELMARASHAVEIDGDVWLIDPVDAPDVDDLFAEFGDVEGIVVLSDRHGRDADAFAARHDAPIYVPSFVEPEVESATIPFSGDLEETGFRLLRAVDVPGWREGALFDGETLVVADALGTVDYFLAGKERLGVHPMLRAFPPSALQNLRPERVFSGHGPGITADAADAFDYALSHARSNAPAAWLSGLRALF